MMREQTTILEPDDFADDWYGWLTNQVSHIGLGIFAVFFLSLACFLFVGEMPYKIAAYTVILLGYLLFEIVGQGWRGWDSMEDTAFVVAYGAGGVLSAFSEVSPGSPMVSFSLIGAAPFFFIAAAHLAAGVMYRRKG